MLRILSPLALVFLVSCVEVMTPLMSRPQSEFIPTTQGQTFPRNPEIIVVEPGQSFNLSGYTQIGTVATRIRSSFCSREIGNRSCDVFEGAPDRARESTVAEARAAGGDLVVLSRGGSAGRVFSPNTLPNSPFGPTYSGFYGMTATVYRRR